VKANNPTPKRNGRPRNITPELEAVLFRGIAEGLTVRQACEAAGISYSSVARTAASDAGFRDRLARAYLHGSVFSLDDAEDRLRRATPKNIQVAREVAHHARWRASRLLPAFSDRLKVETTQEPPRWEWQGKSFIEWSDADKLEWTRVRCFQLVRIAQEFEKDWRNPRLSEATAMLSRAIWETLQGKSEPAPPQLLAAPVPE
jgi:hypothetical protein